MHFSIDYTLQVLLVLDRAQTYHFDNIFTDGAKQEDVYKDSVKLLVENVKAGYNCTVFAYGQTGTGKTYTIGTNPNVRIIFLFWSEIF
jgi:chromosomal replication initiation ATPase DnaA